ncbi:MAG: hypothetical protein ACRDQ5_22315 [Sciscionella sp.]
MSSTAAQVTADPPLVTPQRRRGTALAPLRIVCGVLAALVAAGLSGLSALSGSGKALR